MAPTKNLPLPLASFQLQDLRASAKRLVGCYPEILPPDGQSDVDDSNAASVPVALRRWPGISNLASTNTVGDTVRGMWEMAGTQYAVIGSNFYSVSSAGILTKLNIAGGVTIPITGSGFVKMTDNGACLVILQPGTTNCWTFSPNNGGTNFQLLTSAFFQTLGGALDCWFVDTFIVFLANNNGNNGSYTFFNDDGRQVSGNLQITFTTAASFSRQFGTDPFFAMAVDHRQIVMFGSRSTEGFVNTGNATGTPFSAAADTYMPYGVHPNCTFSPVLQDSSVFWIANDLTVRRREGQSPVRVSNPGIELILQTAQQNGQLAGTYCLAPTWHGHPMVVITIPLAARSLVYDCVTQQWFELSSIVNGQEVQWRPLSYFNGFGRQLVGDGLSGTIGYLDPTVNSEYGSTSPTICQVVLQPIYNQNKRVAIRRFEVAVTAGQGTVPAYAPQVDAFISDNWGTTFDSLGDQDQTLGVPGDFENRSFWLNLGAHPSATLMVQITDASPVFFIDANADIELLAA